MRVRVAVFASVALLATGCYTAQDEAPAGDTDDVSSATTASQALTPSSSEIPTTTTAPPIDSIRTTTVPPSPYGACADYRSLVQSTYDRIYPRIDELRNESWSEYPSPNTDGVQMSLNEAMELGGYLNARASAQANREAMETLAALIPPSPIQDLHVALVEALYAVRDIEYRNAAALYPSVLYGEPTGFEPDDGDQKEIEAARGSVYAALEEAVELAILLCPDP